MEEHFYEACLMSSDGKETERFKVMNAFKN
jgi:hypothetical protein